MKLIIFSLLLILSSCSFVMTKHQKGLILFNESPKKITISDKVVSLEACNKAFILPYKMDYFSNEKYFSKELEKFNGIGLADAQIQTVSYWKFLFGVAVCEEIQGKVVLKSE